MRNFWVFIWKVERLRWWVETDDDEMVLMLYDFIFIIPT